MAWYGIQMETYVKWKEFHLLKVHIFVSDREFVLICEAYSGSMQKKHFNWKKALQ